MGRHACETVTAVEAIEKLVDGDPPKVRLGLLDVWLWKLEDKIVIVLGGCYYDFIDMGVDQPKYSRTNGVARVDVKAHNAQQLIDECPVKVKWANFVLGRQITRLAFSGSTPYFEVDGNRVSVKGKTEELFSFDATTVIKDGVVDSRELEAVIEKGLENVKAHV